MFTWQRPPYLVRPVRHQDNLALKEAIFTALYAYNDAEEYIAMTPQFSYLAEYYSKPGSRYWVVENTETGEILGGAGYERYTRPMPVGLESSNITEFQKFYFHPKLQGQGIGKHFLALVLETAKADGYDIVYLETIPLMQAAISLYERNGFMEVPEPWGQARRETLCTKFMAAPLHDKVEVSVKRHIEIISTELPAETSLETSSKEERSLILA